MKYNVWTSSSRLRNPLFSWKECLMEVYYGNILLHLVTSPQRLYMHWLCREVQEAKLTLLILPTGQSNINQATSTFFMPKFAQTLDKRLWNEIAPMTRCRTVAAKLLLLHCKYLIIWLHPSVAPFITILQHFIWW